MSLPEEIAVWGDELLERGDPLGEIIAMARSPENKTALDDAQRAYVRKHFRDDVYTRWHQGVLYKVDVKTSEGRRFATDLADCPATRFLRSLIMNIDSPDPSENPIPILAERGLPSTLRELTLSVKVPGADYRPMRPVFARVPSLELFRPAILGALNLPALRWLVSAVVQSRELATRELVTRRKI